MSEADDVADVRRVLAGDQSAFAGIVSRWQAKLIGLAWRFCHDRTFAEDMAQDAFLKAYRSLGSFRGDARFSTWLTAVALNSYRNALARRPPLPVVAAPLHLMAPGVSGLEEMEARETARVVRELVVTLPPRYRDPLVLFYFQEQDLSGTAAVLGLPEGTVKARLHRGRALLRERAQALLRPALQRTPL